MLNVTPLLAATGLHGAGLDFPLLTVIVLLPLFGAVLITLGVVIEFSDDASRKIARVITVITGLLTVFTLMAFNRSVGGYQFTTQHKWLTSFGADWKFAVDGISLFALVATGILFAAVTVARSDERMPSYYAWLLLLESACLGTLLAADAFMFFVCFQLVLVPLFFLVQGWGGQGRERANARFFASALVGAALLLVSILAVVFIVARNTGQAATFDFAVLEKTQVLSQPEGRWLLVGFALAFALRTPLFPLHWAWTDLYEQAPRSAVVVIAGVVANLGGYGLIRFATALFPKAIDWMQPALLTVGVVSIVFGAVMATRQRNLRRILAYAAVGQSGVLVVGAFSLVQEGVRGAVVVSFAGGLAIGTALLGLTLVYQRTPIVNASQLIGLRKTAPVLFVTTAIAVLAAVGLPSLALFIGEYHVFKGTLDDHQPWAIAGIAAAALLAIGVLYGFRKLFSGEAPPASMRIRDLSGRERLVIVPLLILLLVVGLYPRPVTDRIQPAVARIVPSEVTK